MTLEQMLVAFDPKKHGGEVMADAPCGAEAFAIMHRAARVTRPDTSARLQGAHAALSHTQWLEQKVRASRAGLADGTNKRINANEWESIRAAKQAQRDTQ